MKKFFTLALAFVVMSFAACGVKTGNTAELDSLAFQVPTDEIGAVEQADAVVTLLEEQLQHVDPEQVKAISAQIAEQVAGFIAAGDEEAASRYTTVISEFISQNALKLQEAGVPTAIAAALASVKGIPADIMDVVTKAAARADTAAVSAQQAADATKQVIEAVPEGVKEAVKEAVKEQTGKIIDDAAAAAKKELGL